MSEFYNPETVLFEEISRLTLEARRIRVRYDAAHERNERRIYRQQLRDVEARVDMLRHRINRARRRPLNHAIAG